jgi:radical SAM family uncharacterized protein
MLEEFLLQVRKPAQYIGREWNVTKKDFAQSEIKFALCFPDLYEVGMSNLGVRIIYGILNSIPDVCCERFFSPALDMEGILRNRNLGILSLESKRSLREFDMVGFSLGYELTYTNVLNILDLAKFPLKSSLRDLAYPLIIGGGPCVMNPEPLWEFFDLFIIGEAEEAIVELINLYRKNKDKIKTSKISKEDLLVEFSDIEGVYAPSLYEVTYNSSGQLTEFKPRTSEVKDKIKKRFVRDLNYIFYPLEWLVPYIQIIHDRISLEIMRGCPNQCRFCQARTQYFPFRLRDPGDILNKANELYRRTGYEEISLLGLSVSDYPDIGELLKKLIYAFGDRAISVSLPSIKPKEKLAELSTLISGVKKTGLTFAPEAATERLRKVLNKDFDVQNFFKEIEQVYLCGYQHVKLYFMIGLPYEEKADLDAIVDFAFKTQEIKRKINQSPAQVNISINTLIPKPHTPLQWFKMEDLESIESKQNYLRRKIRDRKLKLSFHNPKMSFLEGVFSRGDRRLSEVILLAFNKGARFDSCQNHFKFLRWLEAFKEIGLDPLFYLKEKSRREILPWDFLEVGIRRQTLEEEFNKVIAIK